MSSSHQLVFYTAPREAVHIANLIAAGGEGGVYNVFEHPDLVAKIFHPKQRTAAIAEKLQVMMQFHPTADVNAHRHHILIAWPTHIIYKTPSAQPFYTSANGTENLVVGYLMPKLKNTYAIAQLLNPNFRQKHHPELNHRHIYRVAINLVRVVSQLHASGIVIGDINEKNFHFTKELDRVALVSIIDCDSMQIRSPSGEIYPCTVVVPEYTAPELHGKDIRKGVIRTEAHDLFGLAVLLYKLLMQGFHPFQGIPSAGMPQVESAQVWCIKNNVFPHIANSFYEPPRYAPRITSLPAALTTLFLRAFLKGYTRPTAHEWEVALTELEQSLVPCANDDSHIHPAGQPCVVCEWEYANGKRSTGGQVAPAELADMPLPPLVRAQSYGAVPAASSDVVIPERGDILTANTPAAAPPAPKPAPVAPPNEPTVAPEPERVIPPSVWSNAVPPSRPTSQSHPMPVVPAHASTPPAANTAPPERTELPLSTTPAAVPPPVDAVRETASAAPEPAPQPASEAASEPASDTPPRPQIRPSLWSSPLPGVPPLANPQPVSRINPAALPPSEVPVSDAAPVSPAPAANVPVAPLPVDLARVPEQTLFSESQQRSPAVPEYPTPVPAAQAATPAVPPPSADPIPAPLPEHIADPIRDEPQVEQTYVTDTLNIIDDNLPAASSVPRSLWSTPLQSNEAARVPVESALRPLDELPPLPYDPYRPNTVPPATAAPAAPEPDIPQQHEPSPAASRALWSSEAPQIPSPPADAPTASPRTQFLPPLPDDPTPTPPTNEPPPASTGRSLWSTPLQPHEATRVPVESGSTPTRPMTPADAIPIMTSRPEQPAARPNESIPAGTPAEPTPRAAAPVMSRMVQSPGLPVIAAGNAHVVALRGDGSVATLSEPNIPALAVPAGLQGCVAVAAGASHSAALHYNGKVTAWGSNSHGQCQVPANLPDIQAIAAGGNVTLALTADQRVIAWGDNAALQCQVPPSLDGVVAIAAGMSHAMAVRRDGSVVEWGTLDRDALLDARAASDVIAVAAHDDISVALQRDGSVVCWGPRVGSARAAVRQLPPIRQIAAGRDTIVAVDDRGTVHVISPDHTAPLQAIPQAAGIAVTDTQVVVYTNDALVVADRNGTRSVPFQTAHTQRIGQSQLPQRLAMQQLAQRVTPPIAAGYEHTVGITADGAALSWGDNTYGQRTAPMYQLVAVAAGGWHALGYDRDGRIHAWGRSNHGQTIFATVSKFRAVGIAAGMVHSIAVGDDGRILAWGNNDDGQCSVPQLSGPGVAVAAGMRHSLALLDDGTVHAWGNNNAGQCTVPADVHDVVAIAAGGQSSAALRADGAVVVWGELAVRAQAIAALRDGTAIALGGEHGVVLRRDGRIECFGNDDYGQCSPNRSLPPIAAITCGTLHTVVLTSTGDVLAWGRDSYQQTHVPGGVRFRH